MKQVKLNASDRVVGQGQPCYIISEIGINWDGIFPKVFELMKVAKLAGVDAVKFQKRTPDVSTPHVEWERPKETPWGETIPYILYRQKMEFSREQWWAINDYARSLDLNWFTSVWDVESVNYMEENKLGKEMVAWKVPSAMLTNDALLERLKKTGGPIFLSTGMSTWTEIQHAVELIGNTPLVLFHCHSAYPAPVQELHLNIINSWNTIGALQNVPIGYSAHETGLATTVATVALGACAIERHITLDRSSLGTDHAASTEGQGFAKLVRDVRAVEKALGEKFTPERQLHNSELAARTKLRGIPPTKEGR